MTPAGARPLSLSVVIPAYNEARRLPRTLTATVDYLRQRGLSTEILVVDDGSRDETAAVAGAFPEVTVLGYGGNRGKGFAVRHGILHARGERVLFMDADLATPIEELEKLEAALATGAAVAIGSRPLQESELTVRQPWLRELSGRAFNQVVQTLATPGIHDTQCGFKLLTREAAQAIFSRVRLDGFSFDVEALFLARRLGLTVSEVPVRWAHQEGAVWCATRAAYLRHGIAMLTDVARIRWMHRAVRPAPASQPA